MTSLPLVRRGIKLSQFELGQRRRVEGRRRGFATLCQGWRWGPQRPTLIGGAKAGCRTAPGDV